MRDTGMGLSLGYSRLGTDHPVEGEIRSTSVHPDDDAAAQHRAQLALDEYAAWRALHHRALQTEHPVEGRR